ncbi:coiled-coil domain-containing protein 106-like [Gymnodraco acuticeps]|uniref:Coiled-coil domain-containing protein 106-like n=1 Tax=Gymnodraco acuticeps TaxID=8218 RepID=A0A6P8W750_GYMAC|nr:coiled-coil domain-containing protein 106-like [Gymnodraco acuticeps]
MSEHPGTSAEKAQEYEDPSLQTALQEAQQMIYGQNQEIATLREWVNILTEDRNFLRERLKEALALRKERGGELATKIPPGDQPPGQRKEDSDESDLSSSSDSSESESSSESSEDKKPKKKSKSKRKLKRKSDKKKRKHLRVKTPDHSIRRYNMVLEMVKKEGISKAVAYTRLGVDRNTIVYQAPIAEIAFVNPELQEEGQHQKIC